MVVGCGVLWCSNVHTALRGLFGCEDGGNARGQNVGKYMPVDTASFAARLES